MFNDFTDPSLAYNVHIFLCNWMKQKNEADEAPAINKYEKDEKNGLLDNTGLLVAKNNRPLLAERSSLSSVQEDDRSTVFNKKRWVCSLLPIFDPLESLL